MRRLLFAAMLIAGLAVTVSAQSSPAAQAARQWRQQHERAIVDEFVALLAIPNVARDRGQHPAERRGDRRDDGAARHRGAARVGAGREPGGVRRDPDAWRDAHDRASTPTTTASRSIRRNGRRRRSRRRCATSADRGGGQVIPLPPAGTPFDPGVAPVRARSPATTRRRSSRC